MNLFANSLGCRDRIGLRVGWRVSGTPELARKRRRGVPGHTGEREAGTAPTGTCPGSFERVGGITSAALPWAVCSRGGRTDPGRSGAQPDAARVHGAVPDQPLHECEVPRGLETESCQERHYGCRTAHGDLDRHDARWCADDLEPATGDLLNVRLQLGRAELGGPGEPLPLYWTNARLELPLGTRLRGLEGKLRGIVGTHLYRCATTKSTVATISSVEISFRA